MPPNSPAFNTLSGRPALFRRVFLCCTLVRCRELVFPFIRPSHSPELPVALAAAWRGALSCLHTRWQLGAALTVGSSSGAGRALSGRRKGRSGETFMMYFESHFWGLLTVVPLLFGPQTASWASGWKQEHLAHDAEGSAPRRPLSPDRRLLGFQSGFSNQMSLPPITNNHRCLERPGWPHVASGSQQVEVHHQLPGR